MIMNETVTHKRDMGARTGGASVEAPVQGAETRVLELLRRIIRASDVFSKRLHRETGLTTAQALALKAIGEHRDATTRRISDAVALSPATLTSILDRLEANGLVTRTRSAKDRRIVHSSLTAKGRAIARTLPPLLDKTFLERFARLSAKRKAEISSALEDIVRMMDADANDAAPAVNGRAVGRVKRG